MRASTTMTRDVIVVPPELPLGIAWEIMRCEHIRHLPVVRAGALVGMRSDRDVMKRAVLGSDGELHVASLVVVGEAMTPPPLATCEAEAEAEVADIARMMIEQRIDAVPVVRGLRLMGLITSTDLLHLLVHRDEARPLPFEFRLVEDPRASA